MKIVFIGDVMLGRFVREKYENNAYDLISDAVRSYIDNSNYVIANLESPVTNEEESDSLKFAGSEELLGQFRWVDCFSLSNNHINDFGEKGMRDTIDSLNRKNIGYNGLFEDVYNPYIIEEGNTRIAIITCTDMLNYEFSNDCKYKTIRVDNPQLGQIIEKYKNKGFFIIIYAHVGSLFCRYPNPLIRDILYGIVDKGADCIVTAHSHCLGGIDKHNDVPIFYSLGDFLMDGSSFRRRQAGVLRLEIENNVLKDWELLPVVTNSELTVVLPNEKQKKDILESFNHVTQRILKNKDNYQSFYARQYKKEMFNHSVSTLSFIYKTKGLKYFFKTFLVRSKEITKMIHPTSRIGTNVHIGKGCYVGAFTTIAADAYIDDYNFIQTNTIIGHDVHIGKWNRIDSYVMCVGGITIGEGCMIHTNAMLNHNVRVGNGAHVGACSFVVTDVPDGATVFGNPARRLK